MPPVEPEMGERGVLCSRSGGCGMLGLLGWGSTEHSVLLCLLMWSLSVERLAT